MTGSVDMVELLSAVLVVVDCIEEVDTAEDVSPSVLGSKVDEVTCCLGDIEKRALCADEDDEGICCETTPGEVDELAGLTVSTSTLDDELEAADGSILVSSCS